MSNWGISTYGVGVGGAISPFIPMVIETPWYGFAGLMGYSRLYSARILGQCIGDGLLQVQAQYDHDPVWKDAQTFDLATLLPFDHEAHYGTGLSSSYDDQAMMLEFATSRQKISAIRFRIEDLVPVAGTAGEAWSISGVTFEVGLKGRARPLGSGRNF